jgi:hypothetical protein
MATSDVEEERLAALAAELAGVPDLLLRPREPLSRHNPFRAGGIADLWAVAQSGEAAYSAMNLARNAQIPVSFDWPHQERLIRAGGMTGLVIRPGRDFERLETLPDGGIRLGAACPFGRLIGLGGPFSAITYPGCPGAWSGSRRWSLLAGQLTAYWTWRARGPARVAIDPEAPFPDPGARSLLFAVEFAPPQTLQVLRPAPPLGSLFVEEPPGVLRGVYEKTGIVGSRLKAWRLGPGGVISSAEGGDVDDLILFGKALQSRLSTLIGAEPPLAMHTQGRAPIRRRPRKDPSR